jgi:hypothetical protein
MMLGCGLIATLPYGVQFLLFLAGANSDSAAFRAVFIAWAGGEAFLLACAAAYTLWWRAHPSWLRGGFLAGIVQILLTLVAMLPAMMVGYVPSTGNVMLAQFLAGATTVLLGLRPVLLGLLLAHGFASVTRRGALAGLAIGCLQVLPYYGTIVGMIGATVLPTLLAPVAHRHLSASTAIGALAMLALGGLLGVLAGVFGGWWLLIGA